MGHRAVAVHYIKRRLFWDVLTTVPWDVVMLAIVQSFPAGLTPAETSQRDRYIGLLGLLRLGRMYRVVLMYNSMSYNLNFSLLVLTLFRNFTFSFYLMHWAACTFWYIAWQEGQGPRTWVAREQEMLSGRTTIELYIFSFYWALVTFATLGYGDVTPGTTAEVLFTIVYVSINIVVWAYILGTITLLVTKQDADTGHYRTRMVALNSYCSANNVPKDLKHTMAGLLRLHMSLQNESLGDEQVLAVYPTTIRRRILRQLYLAPLKECYLFQNCGVKFLDALMLGASVELFLPKVEIVSSLDHVNELYIVVAGHVELVTPSNLREEDQPRYNTLGLDGEIITSSKRPYRERPSHASPGSSNSGGKGNGSSGWVSSRGASHPATVGTMTSPQPAHADLVQTTNSSSLPAAEAHASSTFPGSLMTALLPKRLISWLSSHRAESWRNQLEQLQQERATLAAIGNRAGLQQSSAGGQAHNATADGISTDKTEAEGFDGGGPLYAAGAAGVNAWQPPGHMPAAAVKRLDKLSKMPSGMAAHVMSDVAPSQDQAVAAVAYFTEVPKAEAVQSLTVCRVLVIPRSTYNSVARDFPLSARQVLENLRRRAAELVANLLPEDIARGLLQQADQVSTGTASRKRVKAHAQDDFYDLALPHSYKHQQVDSHTSQQPQQQPSPPQPEFESQEQDATGPGSNALQGGMIPAEPAADKAPPPGGGKFHTLLTADQDPAAFRQPKFNASEDVEEDIARALEGIPHPSLCHQQQEHQLEAGGGGLASPALGLAGPRGGLEQLVNKAAAKFDQQRLTAFLDAAADGELDIVQSMLRQGMNPDSADYDGRTALMFAAYKDHKDVVLALLFVGGDPTLKDAQGFDAMIEAARGGSREVIEVLTRSGARTGISRVLQASLLCKATYEGKLDRLSCLILSGCDVGATDYDGQTALHVAAADGNLPAARLLVKAGADVTLTDRWGYSPMDLAYKAGAAPLVELFETIVSPEAAAAADKTWRRDRAEAALTAARYGDCGALQRLLKRGCPVDVEDYEGKTLLFVAVTSKQEAAVKVLLAAGANPNTTNTAGSSPLLEAALIGSSRIQAILMAAGARLNLSSTEEAMLLSSVIHLRRHDQLLNLLTAGANAAAADYDLRTPLHIAASIGDMEALRLLAAAVETSSIQRMTAFDWQARDRLGDTPLQVFWECTGLLAAPAIASGVTHKVLANVAPTPVKELGNENMTQ
eukprot:gene2549-2852_t